MLPTSRERVPLHTSDENNQAIQRAMEARLRFYAATPTLISTRLQELDEEWDIERAIEMNAAALAFTGLVAGTVGDRRWLLLPALVTGFLFQHAVQGWCPPVPILRKLGFRTVYEIEKERHALKALRGDYVGVGLDKARSPQALSAAAA
jgi:hypothetical protein